MGYAVQSHHPGRTAFFHGISVVVASLFFVFGRFLGGIPGDTKPSLA
jgi:hypothetical protein